MKILQITILMYLLMQISISRQDNMTYISRLIQPIMPSSSILYNNITITLSTEQKIKYESKQLQPINIPIKYCHTHSGQINIVQSTDIIKSNSNSQYIYNTKYQILYQITHMEIYAIKIKSHKNANNIKNNLDLLGSINLNLTNLQCNNKNIQSILSKNQQYLYIFSCNQIVKIHCNRIISFYQITQPNGLQQNKKMDQNNMKKMDQNNMKINQDDSKANQNKTKIKINVNQQNKNTNFEGYRLFLLNDYIFCISLAEGTYLIIQIKGIRIYQILINGNLNHVHTLNMNNNKINKQPQIIIDAKYHQGYLYILTKYKGIYVYKRQADFKFTYLTYIVYEQQLKKTNNKILIISDILLVSTQSKNWQFIAAIKISSNHQNKQKSYKLLRYYKGYRKIRQFMIYKEQRLLIVSNKGIQIFPIFQDPTKITLLSNGISNNHFNQVVQIKNINKDLFLFKQQNIIYLANLLIQYPYFQCQFPLQGEYHVQVKQQCNINNQPDKINQKQIINNTSKSKYCQQYDKITFIINQSGHKLSYLSFIIGLLSLLSTFLVILYLIFWRQKKLNLISHLITQINTYKLSKMKNIQFQQSQPARQRKWDQLNQQFPAEDLSYKFDRSMYMRQSSQNIQQLKQQNQLKTSQNFLQQSQQKYNQIQINSYKTKQQNQNIDDQNFNSDRKMIQFYIQNNKSQNQN